MQTFKEIQENFIKNKEMTNNMIRFIKRLNKRLSEIWVKSSTDTVSITMNLSMKPKEIKIYNSENIFKLEKDIHEILHKISKKAEEISIDEYQSFNLLNSENNAK